MVSRNWVPDAMVIKDGQVGSQVVGAFKQEKALVVAISVIVKSSPNNCLNHYGKMDNN